ncbi:unnamed protein product [Caenorhabditis bovis]|uniref:Sodium/potassium-transporting ATPase subunit beta n=1 Tax=Caenorhabditis bovis TaxID=2654633 RepID=A0A8S1F9J6_9PELO|nr:unnamed protein product [Caenorhabditis bovis]
MAAKGDESATLMNGVENVRLNRNEDEETFKQFLYNPKNKTVLGRTGKSWCQITVFYIIFYALLAAFWLACLTTFLKTLDPKVPRFYGKGTIIGVNPGVGYQPWLKENPDSTLIQFNLQDPASWKPYVDQLDNYMGKYSSNVSETRECGPNDTNDVLEKDGDALPCRFDVSQFDKGCSAKTGYGYQRGAPCVVISLNRLIGWRPVDYPAESIPEEVKDRYKKGSIAINCRGVNPVDVEHIGKVTYLPPSGIDGRYYPYVFVPSYQQPIAMVKFESIPRNKLVLIECRAYALNIEHDISTRLGMVHFEVMVEDKKKQEKKEL